jgi:hypothetical protein
MALLSAGLFARRDGRAFLVALAAWALGRTIVAGTWRDPAVLGPLRADQLISLLLAAGCIVAIAVIPRLERATEAADLAASREPEWPDPQTRPRF